MTREAVYQNCLNHLSSHNSIMLELPTGYGKTKLSIDLVNHLCDTVYKGKKTNMLLLVAKRVHKQTWKEEFDKWGGIKVDNIVMECYESLKKHENESFTFIMMDEVHHVKSDIRLGLLDTLSYDYMFGLSATISRNLKSYLKSKYHSFIFSSNIKEAIDDDVLPEPEILLMPLALDNVNATEQWEINPSKKGRTEYGEYKDKWQFKNCKVHAFVKCTQKQYLNELNSLILWEKNKYLQTRNPSMEKLWLHHCGKRLEFLSNCKVSLVKAILRRLSHYRTITFCKTIEQCEKLGSNCIHSQNSMSSKLYDAFNKKRINHITAVNILNENANLVDCKYAIFTNLSSSDIVMVQRTGRAMRHKHPVIIVPYYVNTREEEIVKSMFGTYDKRYMRTINSLYEI